jgi:hypothetical protein
LGNHESDNTTLVSVSGTIPTEPSSILSPNALAFDRLEAAGVISYGKKHETHLTAEAGEIYRTLQPKLELAPNHEPTTDFLKTAVESTTPRESQQLVAGVIDDIHERTEILTPIQSHVVYGVKDVTTGDLAVHGIFTSEKGTKSGVNSECPTTVKLADTHLDQKQI